MLLIDLRFFDKNVKFNKVRDFKFEYVLLLSFVKYCERVRPEICGN